MRRCALVLMGCLAAGGPALAAPTAAEVTVLNAESFYPEGPLWIWDQLYYVEYASGTILRFKEGTSEPFWKEEGCGPSGLVEIDGKLLVSCYDTNELVQIDRQGQVVQREGKGSDGRPFLGPNDFARDDKGGIYFSASGVFDIQAPIEGRIYYIAPDRSSVLPVAELVHYANGLAVTDEGKTLLASEHLDGRVLSFVVAEDGSLSERRVLTRLMDVAPLPANADAYTGPDGLKVDAEGNIYICQYGAGRVLVTDPAGTLLREVKVPGAFVTNVAISPDGKSLVITAATDAWTEPYPGEVYQVPNE